MHTRSHKQSCTTWLIIAGLGFGTCAFSADAQSNTRTRGSKSLRYDQYMGGSQMLKAFEPVVASAHSAVVSIRCDSRIKAFGTIIRDDGYLITKASELTGQIECELADGKRIPAKIIAIDETTDLALLKLEATNNLLPITWASIKDVRVGQWAITSSNDEQPLAVGVISVPNREIRNRLYLGISPKALQDGSGIEVLSLNRSMGAGRAGMKRGDIITHIDDRRVANRDDITDAVLGLKDGDAIQVRIKRDANIQTMSIELTAAKEPDLRNMQGQRSARDYGFDEVIQHDTVLSPRDCGGPLLNSSGKAIGINIARAGRVASYALPTHLVEPAIQRLFEKQNKPAQHTTAKHTKTHTNHPHTKPYLTKALGFEQTSLSINNPHTVQPQKHKRKPYISSAVRRRR